MLTTRLFLASACSLLIALGASTLVAQDVRAPDVENAAHQFTGQINANSVYMRSGPGQNYYPTMRLNRDDEVTVVGIRFEWLKVLPPEGSFSYVAKAYVEKLEDGAGRVTNNNLNVRAGSELNQMKTTVQTRLMRGDEVKIIGEQDEYYKIEPPEGAYLYVSKEFVDPVEALGPAVADRQGPQPPVQPEADRESPRQRPADEQVAEAEPGIDPDVELEDLRRAEAEAEAEAEGESTVADAADPAEQDAQDEEEATEAVAAATERFDALEAEFAAMSQESLEGQSIAETLEAYRDLIASDELPESMRRLAEHRVATLEVRNEALQHLLAHRRSQEEARERQLAMEAEREELLERIEQGRMTVYTAVGTLRTSSLQQGGPGMLYRLTDPATGRTVVYVRIEDAGHANFIGQFIGVRGQIATEQPMNLRVISPTDLEVVDPSLVHDKVIAEIVPPSIRPGTQASIGD